MFGLSELAIILIVVIAIVLAKKGPELARNAGKSARILKAEARAMKEAEEQKATDTPPRVIPGETIPGREEQPPKDGTRP
ncbi:twin-arginine translocase TatA/TatE family subunit [Streptomyces thermocarboxydus]|uniref:Twin-arginine translocase TatA/TatE family subunit n=1 Tax=Streptomyces cellulosae TaxID=1968 RepID=A0ABW6JH40_STRCE|nr:twin-arginine translocase TatA/TatE family subunit [Streptomyces sp. AC04842]MDN3284715.1 twin-arginine translocase TatA/TatE family subunit [Streptomyces thermocarboxydus]GHE38108.1 translocase [Streptomyces cellulosae]